jgi:hypothetical protein
MPRGFDAACEGLGGFMGFGYLFCGPWYFRYNWKEVRQDHEWKPLSLWKGLAEVFPVGVSAALSGEGQYAGKTLFIRGDSVAIYDWKDLITEGTVSLRDAFGLPEPFAKGVDAALEGRRDYAGKAYFFKGNVYCRYNWSEGKVDIPSKDLLKEWKLPQQFRDGPDAVFNGAESRAQYAYFFRGDHYVRYDWIRPLDPPRVRPITDMRMESPSTGPALEEAGEPSESELREEYEKVRFGYTEKAKVRAHVAENGRWIPEDGFAANRKVIVGVYDYYRDLYLDKPAQFLWAGLGRMAGGAVVGGLDSDPGLLDRRLQVVMVRIGKDILHDLAWQHELFLDSPESILKYAAMHDQFVRYVSYGSGGEVSDVHLTPRCSYREAWEKILSADGGRVSEGNRELLENEQWSVIQPHYDHLRGSGVPKDDLDKARLADIIHPYHRYFIEDFPTGEILDAGDRWRWITKEPGMWVNWLACGEQERIRLVKLPFEQICRHEFGTPGRPDLIVGSPH